MKPAAFEYHRPESLDDALALLDDLEHAELLAGNQSLGIIMANRLATPAHLIDLNEVADLAFVDVNDEYVEVGSMTRHRTLERHDELRAVLAMLPEAAEQIAGPAVRNRGTLGGSIAEADPAGNYPTVLVALDAEINVASVEEQRTVTAAEYFIAYMFTDLLENELITSVTVNMDGFPVDRTGSTFVELKRGAQTWPTISAAAAIVVEDPTVDAPVIEDARLALGNAGDIPLRIHDAETALEGEPLTDDALDAAADAAMAAAEPADEMHADAEYKTELAGEYARRSLRTAYERSYQ